MADTIFYYQGDKQNAQTEARSQGRHHYMKKTAKTRADTHNLQSVDTMTRADTHSIQSVDTMTRANTQHPECRRHDPRQHT